MAYTTGTISGPVDLITVIKDAAVAAGWTLNQFSTVGSGRRCHLSKGSLYVNLRAYVNESTSELHSGSFTTQYSVVGHASTGYNAANNWFSQPGNIQFVVSGPITVTHSWGITGLTSTATYHLFTFTSPDAIYCIVERAAGQFQWILFGNLDKNGDSWTGGEFYAASGPWDSNKLYSIPVVASAAFVASGTAWASFSQVRVSSLDSFTGWASSWNFSTNYPCPRLTDSLMDKRYIFDCAPNAFNSLAPLFPMEVFVSRRGTETGITDQTWAFDLMGYMPNLYAVNMQSLVAGQNYSVSTDQFKVFPVARLSASTSFDQVTDPGHSHYFGIAVKSN